MRPILREILPLAAPALLLTALLLFPRPAAAQEIYSFGRQRVTSPLLTDSTLTFRLFAPEARNVTIKPSWSPWSEKPFPLTRDDEGIWGISFPRPEPELYTYDLYVDGVKALDPSNILVLRDGPRYMNAVLVEGGFASMYKEADRRGNLNLEWYDSPTDSMLRRMYVYTPFGYQDSKERYPVLYLLHGGGGDEDAWSTLGRTRQILDNLIEHGRARPMIVVMPNGNPSQFASSPLQIEEKKIDRTFTSTFDNYQSLVADIVPYIDSHYRTIAAREGRAVAGLSMGGGQSFFIAFDNPGTFSSLGIFSSGLLGGINGSAPLDAEAMVPGIFSRPADFNTLDVFYVSCGLADNRIGGTEKVVGDFRSHGYKVIYETFPGDHEWRVWRRSLTSFVQLLFRK